MTGGTTAVEHPFPCLGLLLGVKCGDIARMRCIIGVGRSRDSLDGCAKLAGQTSRRRMHDDGVAAHRNVANTDHFWKPRRSLAARNGQVGQVALDDAIRWTLSRSRATRYD